MEDVRGGSFARKHGAFYAAVLFFWACLPSAHATDLEDLYRNSFEVFQILRHEKGVYRDALRFDGNHFHPSSTATTGMGLVALCIADRMGWIPDAEEQAERTLQSLLGRTPGFQPDRNSSGFYRHFIERETGERAWESEYSTIDTAIMICGALFCDRYFRSPVLSESVDRLWRSIDWSQAVANPETGRLYLTLNDEGTGDGNPTTSPFSEYIILAWLAAYDPGDNALPAQRLWNNTYANPSALPRADEGGLSVLTDSPGRFQSHFTVQFAYYLCHPFTVSEAYRRSFENAALADRHWWSRVSGAPEYAWGLGAGSVATPPGYHADAIQNNAAQYVSPHIVAGFLPIYPEGRNDLLAMLNDGRFTYSLPGRPGADVLWRRSLENEDWRAPDLQGVDYATLLFGLASLPENLGAEFFATGNDFFPESNVEFKALNVGND